MDKESSCSPQPNSSRGWEIFQLIQQSLGEKLHWKLDALQASYTIFQENYIQLIQSIQYLEQHQREFRAVVNRPKLWAFQGDNHRLVHNFLAGCATLVDHTRVMVRELYQGQPFYEEYQVKVRATFAESEVANFIKGLRNWTVHVGLIPAAVQTVLKSEPGGERYLVSSIVLLIKELRERGEIWTAPAKRYLEGQPKDLDLRKVLTAYHDDVVGFHSWLRQRMSEMHARDFAEWSALHSDYRAAMLADGVDIS